MTTYKAQLDDIPLEIMYLDDQEDKALVEYELADTDGSEFDDAGMRARVFPVHVVFKNDLYGNYYRFKEAVRNPGVIHNFVHPEEGLIFGRVAGFRFRVDERRRYAEGDFTFKEQLQGNFETLSPLIQPQIESLFQDGQIQAIDRLKARILLAIGPGASELVSRVVNSSQSFASQFVDASAAVRAFVSQADRAVSAVAGFMSQVSQPADSLIASIEYGTSLPGLVIGSVAQALDRYLSLVETTLDSPVLILNSFYGGAMQLRNAAVGFEPEVVNLIAQTGALLSAQLYKTDNDAREIARVVEAASAWTESGEYLGKAPAPAYLTVEDLERTLVMVRTWLQSAYEADREATVLPKMAAELLRHVNQIKIDRGRTFTVDVPTEIPLVLLCHKYGIPQGSLDRVLSLNPQIRNPSMVRGEVVLYG